MSDDPTPPPGLRDLGKQRPNARLLRQKVWKRMNVDNQHFMGCLVGREGFGKSHSALSIAATVDPDFSADRVFFDPQDLLEAFDSDEFGTGDMLILDEAGVGMGSRSWYEKEQILLNQVLQTVRDDNMGVLFTLPRLSELDSQTRGRLHAFVEMVDVKPGEYAVAKWKRVDPARDDNSKIYYPYPHIRCFGGTHRLERFKIQPPPADLTERYEERKEEFKAELYDEAIDAYDDDDDEELTVSGVADEIMDGNVAQYVSEHGTTGQPYVDWQLIYTDYDLSQKDSKAVKKAIEREYDTDALRAESESARVA